MTAQIGREHVKMRLKRAGDGVPAPAMIAAAMDQDGDGRAVIAPIGIVQPQAV